MTSIRAVRVVAAAVVAAIAAWSSYWHMVHVALRYGERSEVAYVLPLSVDGVLTVAAIVMSEDRRAGEPVRLIAKVAFLVGLSASITANVAAAQPTLGGRLIAAWPAVALLLIVEMLVFIRSDLRSAADVVPSPPEDPPEVPPEPPHKFHPEPHHKFHPEPHRKVHKEPNGTSAARPRRRPTSITRRLVEDILAAEPDLTREELAARIGISTRRLRSVLSPQEVGDKDSPPSDL